MSLKKKVDKHSKEVEDIAYQEELETEETVEMETAPPVDLEQECAEWKDKYLRSMAEFENFRRRSNQEKSDWIKLATQRLALEVCDVLDNFERALMQVDETRQDDTFVKGVQMIEQQLRKVLEKEGIKRIDALGKPFDPSLHEALAHIPSEYEADVVAAVIQNGYTMHDKILRPVRVAVSSGPQAAAQEKGQEDSTQEENRIEVTIRNDKDSD